MSFTAVASRSVSLNFDSNYWDALKIRTGPKKSFEVIRPKRSLQELPQMQPSFSARITQSRVAPQGPRRSRLSLQPPSAAELECAFSAVTLESDTSTSPSELYGDTPSHVRARPVSLPVIHPIDFEKIGSQVAPPPDNDRPQEIKEVQRVKKVYPDLGNTPVQANTKRPLSIPAGAVQTPRAKSLQIPSSSPYSLPTPPTGVRKSILKSSSNLRYSSPANGDSPAFSASQLNGKNSKQVELPRSESPPVLDLRALPYFPRRTHDSRGEALSPAPTHPYQSFQRQPNPGLLPEPNRKQHPIRLPNRLPATKKQYLYLDYSDPSWIIIATTEDLPEHNKLDEDSPPEEIEKPIEEEKDLELVREKKAKRRSMVPLIEYYDLLKETDEEVGVVYNVRNKRFRTEKMSTLVERCYRGPEYKERWGGNTNLQNECAPALIDGIVVPIPLPSVLAKTIAISWLNVLPQGFKYKEKEIELPGWFLTGRSMGKFHELFLEKV